MRTPARGRVPRLAVVRLRGLSRACALLVLAAGLAMLAGWVLDVAWLRSLALGPQVTKANAALGLALLGAAAFALSVNEGRRLSWVGTAAALLAAAIGLLTFAEYAGRLDFGIDQLVASDPTSGVFPPGRPSPAAAAGFVLIGTALPLLGARGRPRRVGEALALVGGSIGGVGVLGNLIAIEAVYSLAWFSGVAPTTSAGLVLLASSVLLARPDRGLARILAAESAGGDAARRMLPVALLAPLFTAAVARLGAANGLYDAQVQLAVATVLGSFILGAVVWSASNSLEHADRERRAAERIADIDTLTGASSRRRLDLELVGLHSGAAVPAYGVIALDADHLKALNDRLGHAAGDDVLRGMAQVMRVAVRPIDVVARVGGDEFIVLLPDADEAGVERVAERLRERLHRWHIEEPERRLRVSMGRVTRVRGETVSAVLARADAELYADKRAARGSGSIPI